MCNTEQPYDIALLENSTQWKQINVMSHHPSTFSHNGTMWIALMVVFIVHSFSAAALALAIVSWCSNEAAAVSAQFGTAVHCRGSGLDSWPDDDLVEAASSTVFAEQL